MTAVLTVVVKTRGKRRRARGTACAGGHRISLLRGGLGGRNIEHGRERGSTVHRRRRTLPNITVTVAQPTGARSLSRFVTTFAGAASGSTWTGSLAQFHSPPRRIHGRTFRRHRSNSRPQITPTARFHARGPVGVGISIDGSAADFGNDESLRLAGKCYVATTDFAPHVGPQITPRARSRRSPAGRRWNARGTEPEARDVKQAIDIAPIPPAIVRCRTRASEGHHAAGEVTTWRDASPKPDGTACCRFRFILGSRGRIRNLISQQCQSRQAA